MISTTAVVKEKREIMCQRIERCLTESSTISRCSNPGRFMTGGYVFPFRLSLNVCSRTLKARIQMARDIGQRGEIKLPEHFDFRGGQFETELTAGMKKRLARQMTELSVGDQTTET